MTKIRETSYNMHQNEDIIPGIFFSDVEKKACYTPQKLKLIFRDVIYLELLLHCLFSLHGISSLLLRVMTELFTTLMFIYCFFWHEISSRSSHHLLLAIILMLSY